MEQSEKIIIYQVFTRLFGNEEVRNAYNGSLQENGCGKMVGFTNQALNEIKKLGATHIWYTGLLPMLLRQTIQLTIYLATILLL